MRHHGCGLFGQGWLLLLWGYGVVVDFRFGRLRGWQLWRLRFYRVGFGQGRGPF
jgi:hypothetical protein